MSKVLNRYLYFILFYHFLCASPAIGQNINPSLKMEDKPTLDTSALNNWPRLINAPVVCNNGKFFSYTYTTLKEGAFVVVKSTVDSWQRTFSHYNVNSAFFSAD